MARRLLYPMPGMQTGTTGSFAKHQPPTLWGGPCAFGCRPPARAVAQIAPSRWPKARTPRGWRNCHETFLCRVRPDADFPAVAAAPSIFQKPAEPLQDCPCGGGGGFSRFPANGGLYPACGGLGNPPHATFSGFPRGHASPRRSSRGGAEAPGFRLPQNPRPRICRNCHETLLCPGWGAGNFPGMATGHAGAIFDFQGFNQWAGENRVWGGLPHEPFF
jgi:hypothetical protein